MSVDCAERDSGPACTSGAYSYLGHSLCMATRPHKIQKVTDRNILSSSSATMPAATAQLFSKDLENVVIGQELWQQQRTKWVGNSTGSSRPASRPVISPDSTYDTLLLTTRPFAVQIPLAEMVDFLQEVWAEEGLYD
ncbi:hypothetical protein WJX79_010244 [Trebouxia sp. C0005]